MSNAIQTNQTVGSVWSLLEKNKAGIAKALPKYVDADRLLRVALNAVKRTPNLQKCDKDSLYSSIVQASILGLEIGTVGEAHLVPYGTQAQLIIGYQGLIKLAKESQGVRVYAEEHCENDLFRMERGTEARIEHAIDPGQERGKVIGYYAVYVAPDGFKDYEYMTIKQIEHVKKSSSSAGSSGSPWDKHYPEMAKKTTIRRLLKRTPLSGEMNRAVELENQTSQNIAHDYSPAVEEVEGAIDVEPVAVQDEPRPKPKAKPAKSALQQRDESIATEPPPPFPEGK